MKIIKTFVAYDDTEFDTEDECIAYEEKHATYAGEINYKYEFLDKDGKVIECKDKRYFDVLIDFLEDAYNECAFIRVKDKVSEEALDWLEDYFGIELPSGECGLYDYVCDTWGRVGA